jgi:hypothetical protein
MPIDYILHEPTLLQRLKIFSNMWWSLPLAISLILIWQSQPHYQWVDQYNMHHTYIDAIFGVRGYSCWNWQVFFYMQVNWGLQIMHRILKLVVLPSDTVFNPLLMRSSWNLELNLLHLRNSKKAAPLESISFHLWHFSMGCLSHHEENSLEKFRHDLLI